MQGVRYSKGLLALHLRLIEDHWEAAQSNQEEDQNCPAMETHKNSWITKFQIFLKNGIFNFQIEI